MAYVLMQSRIYIGSGDPNGQIVESRGASAWRDDGAAGTTLYVKESGDGTSSGWTAISSGGGGGPATQLDADGTVLDINAIADGNVLRRTGTTCVGATCTAAGYALLDDADAAAQRTTLGLVAIASSGSAADLSAGIIPDARMPNLTGDVTTVEGAVTTTIANDAVTFAKMQNIGTDRLVGRDTAAAGDPEEITVGGGLEFTGIAGIQRSALTGDVTAAAGSNSTTIANDAVTNAKLANVGTSTVKGRVTAATGDPEDLTTAQLTTLVDAFTSALKGAAPASGGGTTNFLRADGTWALPPSASGCSLTRIGGSSGAAGADLTWQRLTSNAAANSTTTLTTVMTTTGLTSGLYRFTYAIIYQSSVTTTGVSFAVNYTGTSGAYVHTLYFTSTGGTAATGVADQDTATNAGQMVEGKSTRTKNTIGSATAGVDTINANMLIILEGLVEVTGNGDLELRHASETANSTQVMAQTCLELRKVA